MQCGYAFFLFTVPLPLVQRPSRLNATFSRSLPSTLSFPDRQVEDVAAAANGGRRSSQAAKASAFATGNQATIDISNVTSSESDEHQTAQPLESDEDSQSDESDEGVLDETQPFTERVVLRRTSKGFGFNIKKSMGAGPLLVGKIAPDGEASKHPALQPGSRIVAINGHDTFSVSRGEDDWAGQRGKKEQPALRPGENDY